MKTDLNTDILLPCSCNFGRSFPEALRRGVRFVCRGDDGYPLMAHDASPGCLSVLGRIRKKSIMLLSSSGMEEAAYDAAMLFAYEACFERYSVIVKDGTFNVLRDNLITDGMGPVTLLHSGILEMGGPRRKKMCGGNGGIISPFLPYQPKTREGSILLDRLVPYFPLIVLFGMSVYEYRIASDALDNGAEVFLHRAALAYPLARRLAEEGVPVIDHIDTRKGLVYRNEFGGCSFLSL